jgi:hypothetical protein
MSTAQCWDPARRAAHQGRTQLCWIARSQTTGDRRTQRKTADREGEYGGKNSSVPDSAARDRRGCSVQSQPPAVTAQNRRTGTDTLNSRTEKGAAKKIDENLHKSKGIALKFCTDQIQHTTKLFPKNHRLRLTQTLGN